MNIVLFGFKGVGKTFFGKKIAALYNLSFYDLDENLVRQEGKSCKEIYLQEGEEGFRKKETALLQKLQGIENSVVSLGGGTLLTKKNVELAKKLGILFLLQHDKEILKGRVLKESLPAFIEASNKERSFEEIFEKRRKIFAEVDAIPIMLTGREDKQIIEEIIGYAF